MPRFNEILQTFQNGEVSPRLYGRTDFDAYKRSCRTLQNMVALPQGGAQRRVGSEAVTTEITDGLTIQSISENARILPFVVSETESYLIILPGVLRSSNTFIVVYNVAEDKYFQVTHSINLDTGRSLYQNSIFINSSVLRNIQYVQTGDVMILVEGRMPPQVIKRTASNTFAFEDYWDQGNGGTGHGFYDMGETSSVTIDASATTGLITLTASSSFFVATHVGAQIAFQDGGNVGWCTITGYVSGTSVGAQVNRTLPADATANTDQWYEGAFSDYRGFPRSVALWNGRLFFGGTQGLPDTIWASQTYDIYDINTPTTLDPGATLEESDPTKFTVASDRANYISWMVGGKNDLVVGTRGREYSIRSFTINNIDVRPQTGYGSEYIQPVIVDDVPIYVQRGFRKLREILYDDRTAGYLSPEVTFNAQHLPFISQSLYSDAVSPKIRGMAYQVLDNNILWVWDNNGFLYASTKSRENSVNAFHRHILGGTYSTTLAKVLDGVAVPSADGTTDEFYMLVKRTVNSSTQISLEKMGADFTEDSLDEETDEKRRIPVFMDNARIIRTNVGANFFARLKTTTTAQEGGGTLTGTSTGTVAFSGGKMFLQTSGTNYVDYDGTNNADFPQAGAIRWTWYPQTFGTAQSMFAISQANNNANNLITVATNSSDQILLTINNSAGAAIINAVNLGSTWKAGALTPHHFELNYDLTAGATRLFCNGIQVGSTNTSTGTRNTSIDLIRIGASYTGATPGEGVYVTDFAIFNTVQHTADYVWYPYQKAQTVISRLEAYEGQEVQVMADGNYLGDYTVASGEITIDDEYETLVVGYGYRSLLETQGLEIGSGIGSAQNAPKRLDKVMVRFNSTAQAMLGRDLDNLDVIQFRDDDEATIPLFTGDKDVPFDGDYDTNSRVFVVADDPYPMQVTCIVARGVTYD